MPRELTPKDVLKRVAVGHTALRLRALDASNAGLRVEDLSPLRTLGSLETLDLRNNQLESLPTWLGEMKSLRKLQVSGNQVCRGASEISVRARQGSEALLRHLRLLCNGDQVPANTVTYVSSFV